MSSYERLEQLEREIYHIQDAMESLRDVSGMESILEGFETILMLKESERDQVQGIISTEDALEEAMLEREYWRSVL